MIHQELENQIQQMEVAIAKTNPGSVLYIRLCQHRRKLRQEIVAMTPKESYISVISAIRKL